MYQKSDSAPQCGIYEYRHQFSSAGKVLQDESKRPEPEHVWEHFPEIIIVRNEDTGENGPWLVQKFTHVSGKRKYAQNILAEEGLGNKLVLVIEIPERFYKSKDDKCDQANSYDAYEAIVFSPGENFFPVLLFVIIHDPQDLFLS